jgi:hypothetical protein
VSIVSDSLPTLDEARALLDDAGLRAFTVAVRVITWDGPRVGEGQASTVDTPITVSGGRRPKVVAVAKNDDDIVAGGVFKRARFEVQNITPAYSGGGVDPDTLDPPATSGLTEVFYVLTGPGMPASGMLCKKISDKFDRVFGYSVTLETLGQEA